MKQEIIININLHKMTEPRSIKTEPFSDFPRQAYSIMSDDFCHEKKFVAKFTAKTKKSVVKIKEALSYKKDGYSLDDEVKLWFDLPNSGSLYTKLKSTDYVKIHYDHGLREFGPNKFWNLYTSFNSNKSFQNVSLKLGVGVVAEACVSDNRIKLAMESKNSNHWYWYHRTLVTKDKFNFGLLGVFDLTHKVIQKNNLLLGYAYNQKTNIFLRTEVQGFRKQTFDIHHFSTVFDTFTANIVRKVNDKSKIGLEAIFDIRSQNFNLVSGVYQNEYRPQQIIKVGFNSNRDFSLLMKRPLKGVEDFTTVSLGICVLNAGTEKTQVKSGVEIAVNL